MLLLLFPVVGGGIVVAVVVVFVSVAKFCYHKQYGFTAV